VAEWENVGDAVFQGAAQLNLDAKGRMAVPTRVRDPLTQGGTVRLVLTAHPDGCLLVYPAPPGSRSAPR
jgi:MraZ protein